MKKPLILISILFSSFWLSSCGCSSSGGSANTPNTPNTSVFSAPSNLIATESSSGTVNLSWDSVAGATYKVHQAEDSFGVVAVANYETLVGYTSVHVTATSTEITGLTNGVTYYFVVTALANGKESGASNEVSGFPDFPTPPAPTSLTVTSTSSGTVNLSWTGSAGVHYYKVYQSSGLIGDDLSSYSSYNVTASSTEITGLTNGTRYYFVVTALANGKESGASNEVSGLPEENLIAPPTNLMVIASSGTANLNWTGREGATYKVHQAERSFVGVAVANYETLVGYTSEHVTATSTEITRLINGKTYYFVVTALIDDKESRASKQVIGLPDFPIPPAPTSLTVTSASSGTVSLSWNSVVGATYKVYQATERFGDDLSGHISYDVTETSTKITGLTNGTRYYFVVTALVNGKESPASNEVSELPDILIPSTPTNLKVTSVSSGTVSLIWDRVVGVTYKVYQSTESIIADDLSSYTSYNVTATSTEITGLTNGASYYFVVTALIGDKESGVSNEVIGLPDFPIPPAPTNLRATPSSGTVNLSWTGSAGVTYKVHQATQTFNTALDYGTIPSYTSDHVMTTSTKITGLMNNTAYYFVVTALFANGQESPASDEVSAIPIMGALQQLNDTGITWAGNYPSGVTPIDDCSPTGLAGKNIQDCQHGRDAEALAGTLIKIGGGKAGFDFTKLGSTGTVLSIQDVTWSDNGSESLGTKWSCIRDNVSGLVWEVKTNDGGIHDRDEYYQWGGLTALHRDDVNRLGSYYDDWDTLVKDSNNNKLCGYNDWRIPSVGELNDLMDMSGHALRIDTSYFPNTVGAPYWSSMPTSGSLSDSWAVSFENSVNDVSRISRNTRNTRYRVRLTRSINTGFNSWPDSRYIEHGDGTVTDKVTGLMWTKCPSGLFDKWNSGCVGGNATRINWKITLNQLSGRTFAGYSNWRLPNQKELHTLLAYGRLAPTSPRTNSNIFPNTTNWYYWTSSPNRNFASNSWALHFNSGKGKSEFRTSIAISRMVRNTSP